MRDTTLLQKLLGLKQLRVLGYLFNDEGLIVEVAPRRREAHCSGCGQVTPRVHDRNKGRTWRHLDVSGMKVHLRYALRRGNCEQCGVRVEEIPWAAPGSNFTYSFEDQVGYLAQQLSKSAVSRLMRLSWSTVGDIVRRVVARHSPMDRLEGLVNIGIDELCVSRNEYITLVTSHDRCGVAWIGNGKSSDTLREFFDTLGPERRAKIEVVTLDMSAAFIKGVTESVPQAEIVFDRFHVQRLVHDALDEVRRAQNRDVDMDAEEADADLADVERVRAAKKSRWALQKNPWNLRPSEREKLCEVQRHNEPLYRAYMMKESLLAILDGSLSSPARRIEEWLSWASRSRLDPFIKLARSIRRYKDGILAYIRSGLSNARSEGINGKIRAITKRAFGFRSTENLVAMIFLCCSGIQLSPVFHYPEIH